MELRSVIQIATDLQVPDVTCVRGKRLAGLLFGRGAK